MSKKTKYNRDYFIAKFEAIPEDAWCVGSYHHGNQHCAFGHCIGKRDNFWDDTPESRALSDLLDHIKGDSGGSGPAVINDGRVAHYNQATPKQRILAALRDLPA